MPDSQAIDTQPTLVDVLDRLLDNGVVLNGQILISLAGLDLMRVGLRDFIAPVATAEQIATPLRGPAPLIGACAT